ncbi:MAG: DEAD/DEAH box helicase [Deltaproteobacteria bacterium]|nr:DEAD/DEAH box helicase [Deltaproteobacteria bacterium]
MSFENFGLIPELLKAVKAQGYEEPTPIQNKAIPAIFEGRNILASAQTGTGKTAAFALPLLQILSKNPSLKKRRRPRLLILVPTRELADQVGKNIQAFGRLLSLRSTVIYGGVKVDPQIDKLKRGVDIIVATPGRLLDHAYNYTVDLSRVEFLVFDEADRMLDMGFIENIAEMLDYLPPERQNLMFSATYPKAIKELADSVIENPLHIEVSKLNTTASDIRQFIHPVERDRKRALLYNLIIDERWNQVLVFTRTRKKADKLAKQLKSDGINTAALHSEKTQSIRTKILEDFKKGKIRALIATDVAARGLDINDLPYVVNFDLPDVPEYYVHRIGRTGRAGLNGIAISFVCRDDADNLTKIQEFIKQKISVKKIEGFDMERIKKKPSKKISSSKSKIENKTKGKGKKVKKIEKGKPKEVQKKSVWS